MPVSHKTYPTTSKLNSTVPQLNAQNAHGHLNATEPKERHDGAGEIETEWAHRLSPTVVPSQILSSIWLCDYIAQGPLRALKIELQMKDFEICQTLVWVFKKPLKKASICKTNKEQENLEKKEL